MAETPLRGDLQEACDRLRSKRTLKWAKKSVQSAGEALRPHERVESVWICGEFAHHDEAANGEQSDFAFKLQDFANGILVLTGTRLLFVLESKLAQLHYDHPLSAVDAVKWKAGLMTGQLSFSTGDDRVTFVGAKNDGAGFATSLRAAKAAGDDEPPVPPHPPATGPASGAREAAPGSPPGGAPGARPVARPPGPPPPTGRSSGSPARRGPAAPPPVSQPWPGPSPSPVSGAGRRPGGDGLRSPGPASPPGPPPGVRPAQPAPAAQPGAGPPPGWYARSDDPGRRRWWDGAAWTEHVR